MQLFLLRVARLLLAGVACLIVSTAPAVAADGYQDVLNVWSTVEAPPMPTAQPVTVSHETTALLILDIEELTCNAERRPRCLETVAPIAALMEKARTAHMPVVYSLTPKGTRDTILPPVAPRHGDQVVQASVDKFLNTPLESLLQELRVKTVIITGTAAHGAVLHTATGAAQRGLDVIIPADALSAESPYIEQAATWLLLTGPATAKRVTLTRTTDITIE